jgi:hypothetical protein
MSIANTPYCSHLLLRKSNYVIRLLEIVETIPDDVYILASELKCLQNQWNLMPDMTILSNDFISFLMLKALLFYISF